METEKIELASGAIVEVKKTLTGREWRSIQASTADAQEVGQETAIRGKSLVAFQDALINQLVVRVTLPNVEPYETVDGILEALLALPAAEYQRVVASLQEKAVPGK